MDIPNDLYDELHEEIQQLMYRFTPNPNGSDYECAFCNKRPTGVWTSIEHRQDCFGKKFLDFEKGTH
jgi:hypothetical protein